MTSGKLKPLNCARFPQASALLAEALDADILLMLPDVEAVFLDWGGPDQVAIGAITPDALAEMRFAAGSMGPKITAAIDFVRARANMAGIGRLQDAPAILEGRAGTQVRLSSAASQNGPPEKTNAAGVPKHQPAAVSLLG